MTASARTQGPIASMVLYPTSLMLDHSGTSVRPRDAATSVITGN